MRMPLHSPGLATCAKPCNACQIMRQLPPAGSAGRRPRFPPAPLCAAILMLWNVPSAFLMGTLFTTFISWIRFPDKVSAGGLVSGMVR